MPVLQTSRITPLYRVLFQWEKVNAINHHTAAWPQHKFDFKHTLDLQWVSRKRRITRYFCHVEESMT